ncbi:MAG: M14 family zinc carboxypeptidase [Vulcanibacillus sp.]
MRYVVKVGDTLYKIANSYGVTLNAIYLANPQIEIGEYIYPGQILEVPEGIVSEYIIRRGDSFYYIAEQFGVTVNQLVNANQQIVNPNILYPGQIVYIPRPISSGIVQTNQEYAYNDLVEDIAVLKKRYLFIQYEEIGKSVMGKSIYAVRLGKGDKEIFYSADWHANEYLTGQLLMRFIEDYANAYEQKTMLNGYDVNYLFNNVSIWLVPMVNPDGIDLVINGITPDNPFYQSVLKINSGSRDFRNWSANINGVDLNHQWPADWEEENARSPQVPSPMKYGGVKPLTGPEVKSIYDFTRSHNFRMVLAFHSQGRVIYWGYNGLEPTDAQKIANRFSVLTGYISEKGAYSAAGYKDWFIQDYRRPGFTIEVGLGMNPLPVSQFPIIYRNNLSLLLEAPLL